MRVHSVFPEVAALAGRLWIEISDHDVDTPSPGRW